MDITKLKEIFYIMLSAVLSPAVLGAVIGGGIAFIGIVAIIIKFFIRKK